MKFINENNNEIYFNKEQFQQISANKLNQGSYIIDEFGAKHENFPHIQVLLSTLKPIVTDVDMNEVYLNIARDKHECMVISKDNYVISDNIELAMQFSIWGFNSSRTLLVYLTNKTLSEWLNEDNEEEICTGINSDYGIQAPSAVPGMGDVSYPTSTENGSGDIPGFYLVPTKIKKGAVDERFISELDLQKYRNGSKFTNEEFAPYHVIKDYFEEHGYEKTLNFYHYAKEDINELEQRRLIREQQKLDVHFNSVDELDDLSECMNIPVKRRFKQIESAFSCNTLEGITHGKAGDYVVVGVDDEIYPCDKEIFEKTYMKIETKMNEALIRTVKLGEKITKYNKGMLSTLEKAFGVKFEE